MLRGSQPNLRPRVDLWPVTSELTSDLCDVSETAGLYFRVRDSPLNTLAPFHVLSLVHVFVPPNIYRCDVPFNAEAPWVSQVFSVRVVCNWFTSSIQTFHVDERETRLMSSTCRKQSTLRLAEMCHYTVFTHVYIRYLYIYSRTSHVLAAWFYHSLFYIYYLQSAYCTTLQNAEFCTTKLESTSFRKVLLITLHYTHVVDLTR